MPEKEKTYDIIIVGGGPGGATAGYNLCKYGYNVLIIDKSRFPRKKLCGGLLTYKVIKLLNRVMDITEQELHDNNILDYTCYEYEFSYKGRPISRESSDIPFYVVDREVYDNYLLEKAGNAGAEIITGEKVISCDYQKNEVKTENGHTYSGKFIIAADGVNSIFRRTIPKYQKKQKRWLRNLGSTVEIFIDRNEFKEDSLRKFNHVKIFADYTDWGYAWIFPRKDKLAVGMGFILGRSDITLKDCFYDFLNDIGIEDPSRFKLASHNVPLGNYMKYPVYKNILLVGDAGGYVDPIIGEGIFFAQRTAELASYAIHKQITENLPVYDVYKKLLKRHVTSQFKNAKFARTIEFYISQPFNHYPFEYWMKLTSKAHQEMTHGIRATPWFKKSRIHEDIWMD